MNRDLERTGDSMDVGTTRRDALRLGSGAALAALVAAAGVGRLSALGQEASPAAGDGLTGQYVVVRFRKLKAGQTAEEVMGLIDEGYIPLVGAVPGFVSYFGSTNPDTGDLIYVGVFADKAGADESTRLAGEWLAENNHDFFEGEAVVAEGTIAIAAGM